MYTGGMTAPVDIGTLIVSTPGYCGGRPRIVDTRMTVTAIAALWQQGHTAEDIIDHVFVDLNLVQVHAALTYYFANRDMVDRWLMEDAALHDEMAAQQLREGGGPSWWTEDQRLVRAQELDESSALLRSRLQL